VFDPAGARRVPASLLLLTLALYGVAGWCIWSRAAAPTDGTTVSPANSAVSIGEIVVSDRDPNGPFELGDRVVSIDGQTLAERAARLPGGVGVTAGDTLTYEVIRGGSTEILHVTLHPFPLVTSVAEWWPMLVVTALLVATSFTVFWARPRDPAALSDPRRHPGDADRRIGSR